MRRLAAATLFLVLTGCSTNPGTATLAATSAAAVPGSDADDPGRRPGVDPMETGGADLWGVGQVLDQRALEEGVSSILTRPVPRGFELEDVTEVSCPAGVSTEYGTTAACSVLIAGEPHHVQIRLVDGDGTYEVGFPSAADAPPSPTDHPGWTSRAFDPQAVERDVESVLTAPAPRGFGLTGIGAVTCPAGVEVVAGTTFHCAVSVGEEPKQVPVTVLDDAGRYEVGVPQ